VEIRLETSHAIKYRCVLRDGDTFSLQTWDTHKRGDMVGPKGILSCQLVNPKTLKRQDCTSRILKYAGPNGDFFNRKVFLLDCWPYDDKPHLMSVFPEMHILDASLHLHVLHLAENPQLQIE
jgi:hypothetical protein